MSETLGDWQHPHENEWGMLPEQGLEELFELGRDRNRQRGELGASYAFPRSVSEVHVVYVPAMDVYDERILVTLSYLPRGCARRQSFQWSPSASITLPIDGWQYTISRSHEGLCQLALHPIFPEPDPDDTHLLGIQGRILISEQQFIVKPWESLQELLRGCTDETLLPEPNSSFM